MQAFLHILSIIGIILLILVGIVIALLLLVLFFPFVYKAKIVKDDHFTADAAVKWLFGFLTALVSFADGALNWDVKIAGFSLKPLFNRPKKPKKQKKAKKQPVIMPGEKADRQVVKDARKAAKTEIKVRQGKKKPVQDIYEEGEPKPGLTERLKNRLISLYEMGKIAVKVGAAYSSVKKKLFKILNHVLPKKIKGRLVFGFDDPSMTGKILGIFCAVYPIIPAELDVTPDFTQARFECDLLIKGRIFLIYLLVLGLQVFFNKEVKSAIKQVRKK